MRLSLPLRLTPALEGANFTYGINDATLDAVVKYWRTKYDWKKREARLNSYPHFKYEHTAALPADTEQYEL